MEFEIWDLGLDVVPVAGQETDLSCSAGRTESEEDLTEDIIGKKAEEILAAGVGHLGRT